MRWPVMLAVMIAAPAGAQTSSTQCRWIGNVWSCNSQAQQQGIQPIDQGAILRSGASLVPNLAEERARNKELELQERELELRERQVEATPRPAAPPPVSNIANTYRIGREQNEMLDGLLRLCGSLARDPNSVAEEQRSISSALCYAYDKGRIRGYSDGVAQR